MAIYIYTIFIFSVHLILYSSKYIHYDLLCLIHYIKKIIRRGNRDKLVQIIYPTILS